MTRIKRGIQAKKRHKKVLEKAKGYYGARSRVYRVAKQAVIKAHQYSYRDRKCKKREMRKLWIIRINAALKIFNISYSKFIYNLKKSGLNINRKVLSHLVKNDKNMFEKIISKIKSI